MYKFIIWGTGKVAKKFVVDHYNGFFRSNIIIAFVDNFCRKEPETFFDIPIISPNQIVHYNMDFILIASSFDEEITKQIVNELHIDEKQILHMYDIFRFMYAYWENNLHLSKKKILCIGDKVRYNQIKEIYNHRLNVIGSVEISTLDIYDYDYDYVLLLSDNISGVNGRIDYEKHIIETLHQNFNIPMEQILSNSTWECYRAIDIKMESNSSVVGADKKFLIIRIGPTIGLGAILGTVAYNVKYARENGYIPVVDMMTYHNQYLYEEEIGTVNAWEKYFLQPDGYSLNDALNSKNFY